MVNVAAAIRMIVVANRSGRRACRRRRRRYLGAGPALPRAAPSGLLRRRRVQRCVHLHHRVPAGSASRLLRVVPGIRQDLGVRGRRILVTALTALLGGETMVDWGWRLPFLLAGPLGIIGPWLRLGLPETPAFERLEAESRLRSAGSRFRDVVGVHLRTMLLAIALVLALNVTNYLV